jgi:threonine dehydratase
VDRSDVEAALDRVRDRVRRTPLFAIASGDDWLPYGGSFKLEQLQYTGSFKVRGAFNRILCSFERGELDRLVGVVVASGGNAGLANAYAAARLGVPATVFVPENSSLTKQRRLAEYGATVIRRGTEYAEAYEAAIEHVVRTGAVYCHAYDQPEICAGAGTLGLELLQQFAAQGESADTVIVAVGGGGLMAGVATALDGHARVVGVEPVTAPTLHSALEAGEPVDVAVSGIAADSLGARRIGAIAWDVAIRIGVQSVLVPNDAIVDARRALWQEYRLAVEPAAAAPIAALVSGRYRPHDGERICVVLCGANTDPAELASE